MKGIVKIVHLPSVVQSECYEATIILFVRKENKNYKFIQQLVSSASHPRHRSAILASTGHKLRTLFCVSCTTRIRFLHLFTLWFELKQRIRVVRLTQNSLRSLRQADILQNGAYGDAEDTNC